MDATNIELVLTHWMIRQVPNPAHPHSIPTVLIHGATSQLCTPVLRPTVSSESSFSGPSQRATTPLRAKGTSKEGSA